MTTEHAAWEMFDEAALEAGTTREGPKLAEEVSARVLAAVETCLQRKAYDIFAAVPEPSERFPTSDGSEWSHLSCPCCFAPEICSATTPFLSPLLQSDGCLQSMEG